MIRPSMKQWKLIARLFFAPVFVLGALDFFAMLVGQRYLPTTTWVAEAKFGASLFALAYGVASFFWVTALAGKKEVDGGPSWNGFQAFAFILLSPLVFYLLAKSTVLSGGPMISAIAVGKQTEAEFIVHDASGHNMKSCTRPIRLRDLPLFSERICGTSESFRQTLSRGSKLLVVGRGTERGLFISKLRKVD